MKGGPFERQPGTVRLDGAAGGDPPGTSPAYSTAVRRLTDQPIFPDSWKAISRP